MPASNTAGPGFSAKGLQRQGTRFAGSLAGRAPAETATAGQPRQAVALRNACIRGVELPFPADLAPRRRSRYFTGVRTGASLFLIRNTTNFAGFVPLAFRPTVCTSSGPSWNVSPAWSVTVLPPFRPITMLPSST